MLQGVMVAGGFNIKDSALASVEYLDLGQNLNNISLNNLQWRNLPGMSRARPWSPILVNTE